MFEKILVFYKIEKYINMYICILLYEKFSQKLRLIDDE